MKNKHLSSIHLKHTFIFDLEYKILIKINMNMEVDDVSGVSKTFKVWGK